MIARLWHGWTRPENADKYHNLLQSRILPEIHRVNGYKGAWLMRHDVGTEVEFITVTFWESWDAIRAFAGEDYEKAVYYPEDERYLLEKLPFVEHYELLNQ